MQGDVRVKSKPNRGSNFIFAFPVQVAPELAAVTGLGESVAGTEGLAGKSYLLLDDVPESTFILSQILKKYGIRSVETHSGHRALELFKATPTAFDGVITDLRMPEMSGQTFIVELRRFERETKQPRAVPILVMSAESSTEEKRLCLTQHGANDFLLKPAKLRDLISTLVKLHSARSAARTPRRILIIDDDVISARFMSAVLGKEGNVCTTASSVAAGLQLLRGESVFDVVILDNLLGDGTGADFMRAAGPAAEGLKVISVSGNPVEEQRTMYETNGVRIDGFLQKPARRADLLAMVQMV